MQILVTPDQCFCSFDKGIVYEFVPSDCVPQLHNCLLCAFWPTESPYKERTKCLHVPCYRGLRKDRKGGFWRISNSVDFQQFTKMLESRG